MDNLRKPDWEARISSLISEKLREPHAYGKHDCLLWVAAAVEAATGKDHAKGHKGKYRSAASSVKYLKSLGYDNPEAMLDALLPVKRVGFAAHGDIVMAADGIPALCMGDFALSVGEEGNTEGLVRVPRSDWVKAWAVGDHHSGDIAHV